MDIDYDCLKDLDIASEIVIGLDKKRWIYVVSDLDVDGVCSCAILVKGLRLLGYENILYMTNNRRYSRGVNDVLADDIIDADKTHDIGLVITSDHGSMDEKRFKRIKENLDCKIIVTDHHECTVEDGYDEKSGKPSSSDAFLNPHRMDESGDWHELSGATVAYLLMLRVKRDMGLKEDPYMNEICILAAVTIYSDVMSMDNEFNRKLVARGISSIMSFKYPLWEKLSEHIRLSGPFVSDTFGFEINPMLNSAGRMNQSEVALDLLVETNRHNIIPRILDLHDLNRRRKSLTSKAIKEGGMSRKYYKNKYKNGAVIVLNNSEYNGMHGIVSSSGDKYNEPTVTFVVDGDTLNGSARSNVKGFDMLDVFKKIDEEDPSIIIGYGGHKAAMGGSIHREKLDDFMRLYDKYVDVKSNIETEEELDVIYGMEEFTLKMYMDAMSNEPYGKDKPKKVLRICLYVDSARGIGGTNEHLALTAEGSRFFGFGLGKYANKLHRGIYVYLDVTIGYSNFDKGKVSFAIQKITIPDNN